jgi:LAGLIDADG endonuclease
MFIKDYAFIVTKLKNVNNPQITKALLYIYVYITKSFTLRKRLSMLVGISEAIRLLSTNCNNNLNTNTNNSDNTNKKFNEWLAGLIDGDGCFQLSKKGYASLEIVMELRDKACLFAVKQKFGGSIKLRSGKNHLRYRLHHKQGILNIIEAVNGLIRNPNRLLQLGKICEKYNIVLKYTEPLKYDNSWLAGFFDSDGSVYINLLSDQIFITVSQKNKLLLDPLVTLYGGTIYSLVKVGAFKWTVFKKDEIIKLLDYFKHNPSISGKHKRLKLIPKYFELREFKAHIALPDTILGKTWLNFLNKWNNYK